VYALTLFLQHAIERVERPGGSHEGVGGKKNCNMQLNVLNDLAEAIEGVGRKKLG